MTLELTARQQKLYDYILSYTREHTYQPSIREMGVHMNISSPNGIKCHLLALERKGLIEQTGNARGLIITELLPAPADQEDPA